MADMRGQNPSGEPKDVQVNAQGDLFTDDHVFVVPVQGIPGIATASVYTAADAFGTKVNFAVPNEGTIANFTFYDYDDEGIDKEFVLFNDDFTATADHDAFTVSDLDMRKVVGVISLVTWYNYAVNQIGIAYPALSYVSPYGRLWGQFITRGTDTIAATIIPDFSMTVV